MRPEVRECNPGRRLRRRIGVGMIRDISIKHDIKHVVSVPLKSKAILTTAKAWGQLMACDQAERIADRAIRKARWPIGNIVTIAIIAAFIAVTVLAFVLGRR